MYVMRRLPTLLFPGSMTAISSFFAFFHALQSSWRSFKRFVKSLCTQGFQGSPAVFSMLKTAFI